MSDEPNVVKINGAKFIKDVFGATRLEQILVEFKAIVTGSVVLKFFTAGDYETNDVDILVPVYNVAHAQSSVLCLKILLEKNLIQYTANTIQNLQAYQYADNILCRTDVMIGGKKYQFLFTIISPVEMIREWDLDICQNFWDPLHCDQITVFYFQAVLKRKASFVNMTWRADARQKKYERRGYRFLPVPVPMTKEALMKIMAKAALDAYEKARTRWTPWALHVDKVLLLDSINFVPTNLPVVENMPKRVNDDGLLRPDINVVPTNLPVDENMP